MRSLARSTMLVLALVIATCTIAHATDLCITLETSGTVYVFKGARLKRGNTFPLNGYSNHFIAFPEIAQYPVVGQAILSSDGTHMVLGLTEYDVDITHDIGSHQIRGGGQGRATDDQTIGFSSDKPLGPGSTGFFIDSMDTTPSQDALIVECGPQDNGLTPP